MHTTIASGHWSLIVIEQNAPRSALLGVFLNPGVHSHLNAHDN